ncbi:formate--phosphoribosylaminoimidazolecarboxamide ligase family protein [Methanolobus halotolerans]|uniref:5-formaminoimidazole-4-carboxamide-1-(Beta)-D-ribofuranosyl 5'-monophosphate synthetase n=1 Tax=Methanolobus halotolerans TaxID=2052935 RepID=A0A4E0Q908_9EURY|nr:formate--phosphoribosylaminoimidazolecarboxamide ligase family protein [Methanolobus halotolerans]TGC11380.1 5-formaminoimidazole-4-carboxamide-1-(beta)-D-ribofuranosyl 5'-monophosphate synthetase [Methanolobus halotolerans]
MIDRKEIIEIIEGYDTDKLKIGTVASHSALDIFDGAIEEDLRTLAVCQEGREKTYTDYFRSQRDTNGKIIRGIVDESLSLGKFNEIIRPENQQKLIDNNVLFIPNRSFTSYCGIDDVENKFKVPLVGSRNMLRSEERGMERDYYWLLEKAGLPFPERIEDPQDIDELVMVKLPHAVKKLERGFFTAGTYEEYLAKSRALLKQGVITQEALENARIERYIIGPVFNLDMFYSPIESEMNKLELLGVDWRFETSLDGHVRLPAPQQMSLAEHQLTPEYTVCGHNSATLRESLLEESFLLCEKYAEAAKKYYDPGIIGPFCLQTCVDKDLNFYIYDVAPRVGGGTNVHMSVGHPYGNTLWRKPMSTGRRLAHEVRRALETGQFDKIVT